MLSIKKIKWPVGTMICKIKILLIYRRQAPADSSVHGLRIEPWFCMTVFYNHNIDNYTVVIKSNEKSKSQSSCKHYVGVTAVVISCYSRITYFIFILKKLRKIDKYILYTYICI